MTNRYELIEAGYAPEQIATCGAAPCACEAACAVGLPLPRACALAGACRAMAASIGAHMLALGRSGPDPS